MRPEHAPDGEICSRCGMHASRHRPKRGAHPHDNAPREVRIIGIDGEGVGRAPHRYVYLAAVDEHGQGSAISDPDKLSSEDCLDFLCDLPVRTLVVGFAFVYDLTMMLSDLPDKALYMLFHEETRLRMCCEICKKVSSRCECKKFVPDGKAFYRPISWKGYRINYMNRRLTVGRVGSKRSTTVWDIFRFFQTSFVLSLNTWKVVPQSDLDEIVKMKDIRGTEKFEENREAIHGYCQKECYYLAKLTRALIDAHEDAGLKLRSYFGAGSTASVFLKRVGIADKRGKVPEEMRLPIASAFFGGRFENSVVGPVDSQVYDYDISSAYPYQTFRLPCLSCGHWRHVGATSGGPSLSRSSLHLVHWRSPRRRLGADQAWGPLPVRTPHTPDFNRHSIVFPLSGAGGWCWGEEFREAQLTCSTIEHVEGWVYETDCDHRPFEDIPRYYRERVNLGKDSRGIVLKLGINSIYGKLAQSKGIDPPFQSWVWAGVITSNTRAQLLSAIRKASDPSNIVMLATDGVWSKERLSLPKPLDTGTGDLPKPLGGWEEKVFPEGVFAVRPGIYFPLHPTEDQLEQVRGRGLGRKALYQHWQTLIEAYQQGKMSVSIECSDRFVGAKSGILLSSQGVKRRDCYGQWVAHKVDVSFNPRPKRSAIRTDGSLQPWDYVDFESVPYDPATLSLEAVLLRIAEQIAQEQPDFEDPDVQETEGVK
jgi:hypothetical protein